MGNLRVKLDEKRRFSEEERSWLSKMLSVDFPGIQVIKDQLNNCHVIGICACGCKTIDLEVESGTRRFPLEARIPVEMICNDEGCPIVFNLHIVDGYLNELEVYRADSQPINKKLVNLDGCKININV
ncbi:hypothetical protein [Paenibacillus sp. KS-LC4]|uniref:hypothetical protein n=1 Tax=Paenibacillus sp. KS-LC4 TaxID=2979727 RepID=UPI0030CE534A